MTDPLDPTYDGPSIEDAAAAAASLVHTPIPDAADLPDDVRDGLAGEDNPAINHDPPTIEE